MKRYQSPDVSLSSRWTSLFCRIAAADLRDTPAHAALLARMHAVAAELAAETGYADRGWRLVSNVGAEGGQAIQHLHPHLLADRQLTWPPG